VCLLRGTFYILRSAHTVYLCVLCGSQNKQRLFHCTALTGSKLVGLTIDSTLSWKDHVTELTPKLNKACYVIRTLTFLRSPEILRIVYFSCFHAIMSYGIIFCGNSHHSINIFKIQKRIIRIMTNSNSCDTCRPLFN